MEESKELQGAYKIFRTVVYVSVLVEFFMYAIDPAVLDLWNGIVCDVHDRMKTWLIYHDGNLVYSKVATVLLICITCVGTRNKKHLEFNARRQVLYPLVSGIGFLVLSVWLYNHPMELRVYSLRLNVIFYMAASVMGTILVHVALDNISKFLKEGLLKDRFNLENESFEQCTELVENKYSVNVPMRYYYKGKFRKGWVNIVNPFRGTWVVGTPGSGKTFSIIEPFIRQHSAKGFALVVYDYKFPTLATKLYYHYKKNQKLGKLPKGLQVQHHQLCERGIQPEGKPDTGKVHPQPRRCQRNGRNAIGIFAERQERGRRRQRPILSDLGGQLSCRLYLLFRELRTGAIRQERNKLYAEKVQDKETKFWKPTGVVRDRKGGNIVEPAYWLGKYSDMPHILSF